MADQDGFDEDQDFDAQIHEEDIVDVIELEGQGGKNRTCLLPSFSLIQIFHNVVSLSGVLAACSGADEHL